jgi:hypothetical protein
VVEIVSVAVPAEAPVTSAGLVAPKLSVGRNCAPLGADVITAVSATFPVNPPLGVTVIVDVLAVVAPGVTLTADPLTVKLGVVGAVTITVAVPSIEG